MSRLPDLASPALAAPTTTTLSSSANPSFYGQPVTFTATVTGTGTPTGTVTFLDSATPLATAALNASGVATFTTNALSGGPHIITAQYSGALPTFDPSSSAPLPQQVNAATITMNLTSSLNPSLAGQLVTFTATVTNTASPPSTVSPAGIVTFTDLPATVLGTVPLVGFPGGTSVATLSTNALAVGVHVIQADYTPDNPSNFFSSSTSFAQQVNGSADLSVAKTDSPDPVLAGSNITYTLIVTNAGPSDALNVTLTDTVPANTAFVSFLQFSGPAFSTSTPPVGGPGTVTAGPNNLASGASASFTLVVNVLPGASGTITNTATAVSANTPDPNTANNSATETTSVIALADVSVTKNDTPDPVLAGANITYGLTVSNAGPTDAQNFNLSDVIPAGTTFVSAMQNSGPAFTLTTPPVGGSGTFTATAATLAAGATANFTLVVNVNASTPNGATITNTATVSSTTADPSPANNSATETTSVIALADVYITKNDTPDPVMAGANISYGLTVSNAGPTDAQNVNLSDAVPAGTTFVSALQNSGPAFTLTTPPVGGTGTFTATAATLAAGASATFTLVVNVNASTPNVATIFNTASVSSTTTDPNPANNSAIETTTVIGLVSDLTLTKTDSPDPVVAGTNLTYTLTVTNTGAAASNVTLSETLPISTPFVSLNQNSGPVFTCTTPAVGAFGPISCSIATLAGGATATFSLVVHVNANLDQGFVLTNTATVASSPNDANPANNTASATTTVSNQADISVTKSDSPDPVAPNTNLTYTITVTNNGPSHVLTGITLTDNVPAGTTFVSFTAPAGWTSTTPVVGGTGPVTATRTTLAAGSVATFTLVVRVNATIGTLTNTATVASTTTDPNPANNSASTSTVIGAAPTETATATVSATPTVTSTPVIVAQQVLIQPRPPQIGAFYPGAGASGTERNLARATAEAAAAAAASQGAAAQPPATTGGIRPPSTGDGGHREPAGGNSYLLPIVALLLGSGALILWLRRGV